MPNYTPTWPRNAGVNHVGAYQVSGRPFCSGNLSANSSVVKVTFPMVTRWVQIINTGTAMLKVGFSLIGIGSNEYFEVKAGTATVPLELKISEIFLSGGDANDTSIVAGLTSISPAGVRTDAGNSWSGSEGVG